MTFALLALGKFMHRWHPTASKVGGLPNYNYEPRKPVPLDTMLKKAVECRFNCVQ